ncbi:MAG: DUF859 family phage minor structural protein [Bulleidia sp.]|nr:DUF859 family phage minor structural protein [Bulleidia sp.]
MATERRNYGITSHTSIHVYADETQVDTANNRSYISTELWILGSSYSAYNVDCNVTGGSGYTNSHLSANGWVQLVSGGFWAPHNADGTGSATVGSYYSSGYGNMPYGEFTLTLTKIARASQPSINTYPNNSPDITAGVACTIHMNKHANFTHKVSYLFGNRTAVIATGVVDNCSWTPPTYLLDQIKDATVGVGLISVETYSGSTKIGETKGCNFNLHLPSNSEPTIGAITLTEQHAGVKAKNANVTVQQISKKLVSVPVSAKYSASIKTVTCDGVALSNNNGTYTGYISNKSNGTYKVTATDSRGLQSSNTVTQPFYEYVKPFITATLKRESETSAKGTLSVSGSYSTILSNTISMTIQRNDDTYGTTVYPTLSSGTITFNKAYTDLNYVQSFTIKVKATDGFGESVEATAALGVGQYALWMGKYNVKVGGKLNVGSDLTVGGAITANGKVNAAEFRYNGASPAIHYVAQGYYDPGSSPVYMNSGMAGHRFTNAYIYDPAYASKHFDNDKTFPSIQVKKKGMYLIVCRVRGANVQQNATYGLGYTVNKLDNSGEWGENQYNIYATFYSCAASSVFFRALNANDVLRWQVIADPTRKVEHFEMHLFYVTDQ